jgi:hypothetical protein
MKNLICIILIACHANLSCQKYSNTQVVTNDRNLANENRQAVTGQVHDQGDFHFGKITGFSKDTESDQEIVLPAEFVEVPPPKPDSAEWSLLNHSSNEFSVRAVKGQLEIQKFQEVNECELRIKNGTLVGTDNGEWGGKLIFNPTETAKRRIQIKQGNIKFLFSFNDKTYFAEGLAHLSTNEGSLFQLEILDESFKYKKILDFEDAPSAFAVYQDKVYIATYENFYVLSDFKKAIIFSRAFWKGLYPNSIAVFSVKNVFMGIRGGIVRLDLETKTLRFYKNEN